MPGQGLGRRGGSAAPALATTAVPITHAYQLGPRWRTAGTRGGRAAARGSGGGRWATVTMLPTVVRPPDLGQRVLCHDDIS
ncbi:hypothetical protein GCM10009601_06560 [Streptomyces thermospinosisporus]|uniref:Uncharacterized protein n=1 Tax=Streptomyces thermospinosisporus TaxID=161482 RepID=A0ABP4J8G7_9ACTN